MIFLALHRSPSITIHRRSDDLANCRWRRQQLLPNNAVWYGTHPERFVELGVRCDGSSGTLSVHVFKVVSKHHNQYYVTFGSTAGNKDNGEREEDVRTFFFPIKATRFSPRCCPMRTPYLRAVAKVPPPPPFAFLRFRRFVIMYILAYLLGLLTLVILKFKINNIYQRNHDIFRESIGENVNESIFCGKIKQGKDDLAGAKVLFT